MASTKKKTAKKKLSKKELRKRALKGWETRRARGYVGGKKPSTLAKTSREEELELRLAIATREKEELARRLAIREAMAGDIDMSTFVADTDWMRKDGSLARQYSSLRHMGEASEIVREELGKHFWAGEEQEFFGMADWYAEYFDVEVREVYTLFFSP